MALVQSQQALTPVQASKYQMDMALRQVYVAIKNALNVGKRVIWHNPRVTPQELFDAYGSDAAALCALCASAKELLHIGAGEDFGPIMPADKTITPNEDGTVTVGNA